MAQKREPNKRELAAMQVSKSPVNWAMGLVSSFDKTYKGIMNTEQAQRCAMSAATKVMSFMNEQGYKWSDVDIPHLGRIVVRLAILGLDAESGDWYAYSRRNTKTGLQQFESAPSYQGERKLRIKYSIGALGKIQDIQAVTIREGDKYEAKKDLFGKVKEINFEPVPFNKGAIIGYLGIVLFENGDIIVKEYTPEKIDEYKKANTSSKTPAWDKWPEEMAHAKVIKHTAKDFQFEIPTTMRTALAKLDEEDADEEADQLQATESIDITAEEVEDQEEEKIVEEEEPEPEPEPEKPTPKKKKEVEKAPIDEFFDDDFNLSLDE